VFLFLSLGIIAAMIGSASNLPPPNTFQIGQLYKESYDRMLGNTTLCSKSVNLLGNAILFALFVIGCIGAAGAFPSAALGWTIVGLGVSYMVVKLLGGNCRNRAIDLVIATAITSLLLMFGTLGGVGVLSGTVVGSVLIASMSAIPLLACGLMMIAKH